MKITKVELTKVKLHPSMSQETNCFEATLVFNGQKRGTVCNRGQGSQHEYILSSEDRQSFLDFAKAQPHEFDFEFEDQVVDRLLMEYERERINKKLQKHISEMGKRNGMTIKFT